MITDASKRLNFINLIIEPIDEKVNIAFEKLCVLVAADNAAISDTLMPSMFTYKSMYYPQSVARAYKPTHLRKVVGKLDESLMDEFDGIHSTFVKEYHLFRAKFKSFLSELCRYATSKDCFNSILPDVLLIGTRTADYTPMRSAKGIEDPKQFKAKYQDLLDKAVYYTSIRQLI